MKVLLLAHLLVTTSPYILINTGVYAAESGRPPGSLSCGGASSGASGEQGESEPCSTPAPEPPPQPPPGPSEEKLRPLMERLKAEIEGHIEEPNFPYLVCHSQIMQEKVVQLLEIHSHLFYLKYGVYPADSASLSFPIMSAVRRGTLLGYLRSPEICNLLATFLEVSAGTMGETSFIWAERRRRGPRNFRDTLLLLQHVTARRELSAFLQSSSGRYVFSMFFLTLLRRMAEQGRRQLLLSFDRYITDRIRFGFLPSELKDPMWRADMIRKLEVGDSVLKGAGISGLPWPLEDEPSPSTSGSAPSTSGSAPSTSRSAPSTSASAPSTSGSAPSASGSAFSTSGSAPSASGAAPSPRPADGNLGARPKSGRPS